MSETHRSEREKQLFRSFCRRIDQSDPRAHNNLGYFLYKKGLLAEATDRFAAALELDPGFDVALRNLNATERRSGILADRARALRARLRDNPSNTELRRELARVLSLLGESEAAADEIRVLLDVDPRDAGLLNALALLRREIDEFDDALDLLRAARQIEPESSVILFNLAETYYRMGLNELAYEVVRELTGRYPSHARACYLTSFVLGALGRADEAGVAQRRALQLDPTLGGSSINLLVEPSEMEPRLQRRHWGAKHLLVTAYAERGYDEEASRQLEALVAHAEESDRATRSLLESRLRAGRYRETIDGWRSLAASVNQPEVRTALGVSLHQCGFTAAAIDEYRAVIDRWPHDLPARNNLAVALAQTGQSADALTLLNQLAEESGGSVVSLLNLAHLQRSAGDLATAGEIYRGVLAADPVSVAGWDGIGLVFRDAGRIEEARNAFLRAVEADPESAESHYHLSFAYSELGQFAEALGAVTEAQKLHPYYAPTGYRLVVELLQGEAVLPIALDARTRGPGDRIAGFQFDPAAISGVFAELASGMRARPSPTAATGIAEDYIAKQQYDLATAEVQRLRAAGVDPTDCDLLDARILLARKLYGEALERFEAVLACRPDDYESAVGSAEALLGLQQPDRAYERLRRTTGESHDERVAVAVARALAETGRAGEALAALAELSDPTWKVLDLAGSIATQAGMAAEAREFYSHALHAHPDNAAVYFHLGELELRCDRVEEAVRQFERALAIEPRLHAASLLLARALRKSGDLVRAIDVLVDLLIEDPSLSEALLDLGHCLLDTSRDAAALTVFNRLVARDRGNVSAHFMAGIALARLKRYSDAITAWGMVADLEPESPLGVKARQHVQTAANLDSLFGVDS